MERLGSALRRDCASELLPQHRRSRAQCCRAHHSCEINLSFKNADRRTLNNTPRGTPLGFEALFFKLKIHLAEMLPQLEYGAGWSWILAFCRYARIRIAD